MLNESFGESSALNDSFRAINIGADGGFGFVVRVGEQAELTELTELTEREAKYLVVSSQPYRLCAKGDRAFLSGIEHVCAEPDEATAHAVAVPPGEHDVTVHMIDWEAEGGAAETPPDFVVLINPATGNTGHRKDIVTLD
ncbi:hypothetical protein NLX83_22920 [Allokutzneria sp. A3M-2-11 16]|uniref:hypothetical protein n=1 Tax=Allokutzneria sp. A3M-2-11 16 TaxID=2962043 RepID=UPI0020B745F7|nr:hypothetical protein [Allokutzneria sp. A3M-2-11 16]MCP3802123.1 hypothetical protein [Allokutzneria sp. A3M-2-11 16]